MAVRRILKLGEPLLRQRSKEVPLTEFQSKDLKRLIRDMFDTMKSAGGIGLAAPQIGILKRVVIVGFEKNERYPDQDGIEQKIIINPEITVLAEPQQGYFEGCLSIPGMRGYVERPSKIKLVYFDLNEERHETVVEGFEAVVYQHECDHLDGILYTDRLKDTKLFGYDEELATAQTD